MAKKSRLDLRAGSVADVDPVCVRAFNHFIEKAENLGHVSLHMHATYDAALNRARDNEDGHGGPRLVLSFGNPGSADAVTNWTFLYPNLTGKSEKTRSLHYKKDGTESTAGGTREPVECATGDPRRKKEGVELRTGLSKRLLRRSARMCNSMSFGALFGDPIQGLSGLVDPADVMDIRKAPALAETASHRKALMALVGGAGKAAGLPDPARTNCVKGVYDGLSGVLDGKPYGGLDPSDPLDRMMAWRVLDGRHEAVAQLKENGPERGGLPGPMADSIEAALRAADDLGMAPDRTWMAYKAMGLEALETSLDWADRDIGEAGGAAAGLNLNKYLDDYAVQGLLYLSAYKEIQDHGGGYGVAPGGNGRAESVSVLEAGKSPNVYYKLCKARAEQEIRDRGLQAPPKGRSYPKTLTGGTGPSSTRSLERHVSYRFLRGLMIGDDPELASSAPLGRVYIGAKEKGGAGPVLCDLEPGGKALRLADVLAGKHGNLLKGLPVLEALGQDGYGDSVVSGARALLEKEGGTADILAVEMGQYVARRGPDGPFGRFERQLSAMEASFLENQRGGPLEAGVPTTYFYALNHSSGYPSMRYGCYCMGDGIVAEAAALAPEGCRSGRIREYASVPVSTDPAKGARSFRTLDYGRQAVADAYGGAPEGGWFSYLEAHSGFRAAQAGILDACSAAGDPWAANDCLVLADCYGLWSQDDMAMLKADVLDPEGPGLYRPASKPEADLLRTCYGYANGRAAAPPVIGFELQGTPEGLAAAMEPALEADPGLRAQVAGILEAASLDTGTMHSDPYGQALDRVAPVHRDVSEVRAAVDAAQLAAVLEGGPMAELRQRNAMSDRMEAAGRLPDTPGE